MRGILTSSFSVHLLRILFPTRQICSEIFYSLLNQNDFSSQQYVPQNADLPTVSSQTPKVDEDPHGLKLLLQGEQALNEAANLIDTLRQSAQLWPKTHQLAYEVYFRKGKKPHVLPDENSCQLVLSSSSSGLVDLTYE